MSEPRRCERTGLSIPECSCRACCEELLRGCEPRRRPQERRGPRRRLLALAALALAAAIASGCAPATGRPEPRRADLAAPLRATVDYAVDGDTLRVREPAGELAYVRLVGIDTPEDVKPGYPSECGARAAAASMEDLAPEGTAVRLRPDSVADREDRYGRLLDHAFVGNRQLELAQLRRGWAYLYRYEGQRFDGLVRFEAAERQARQAHLGAWGLCHGDFHSAEPGLQN